MTARQAASQASQVPADPIDAGQRQHGALHAVGAQPQMPEDARAPRDSIRETGQFLPFDMLDNGASLLECVEQLDRLLQRAGLVAASACDYLQARRHSTLDHDSLAELFDLVTDQTQRAGEVTSHARALARAMEKKGGAK